MATDQDGAFKGPHFTSEVILWALRWYLAFPISLGQTIDFLLSGRRDAVSAKRFCC